MSANSHNIILETKNLVKSFKGFVAVNDVNLKVVEGSIHALIGPNGAGKTTCFNLLTKFLIPSSGSISYKGVDITNLAPAEIAKLGVIRSFQISAVFPHMTVLENVQVALLKNQGSEYHFWKSPSCLNALKDRAMELLDLVGLKEYSTTQTVNLPYGRKRVLEIATTLAMNPEMMLLDEPTQGMGHEDVHMVMELIQSVAKGRTILMVEHNMKVVSTIADTISVLQRGSIMAEGSYQEVSSNPQVMEAYMGSTEVAE